MTKKIKTTTERTKTLQEMGAEAQKAAVTKRVTDRLNDLRKEMKTGTVQGPFSKAFVLRWIKVDKHTLKQSYHSESADKVEAFLLETDLAFGAIKRKPKKLPKKRSMREQMVDLAVEAEAIRLRLQCEVDDLKDQLRSKSKTRRPAPDNFRSVVRVGASARRAKGTASASLAA